MTKVCVKCGASDWRKNGDCRQCAIVRDRLYKSQRREKLAEQSRKYYNEHKEQCQTTSAEWRKKNADVKRKMDAEYRAANPEKVAAYKRKHYLENTAKIKKRAADWVKNNAEIVRARERAYRKANPEKSVNAKATRRTRLGNDRLLYGTIPAIFKSQNGLCACCGQPLVKYHVDHIMPLALGGRNIPENIQLLLPICNQKKSAKHPDVWRSETHTKRNPLPFPVAGVKCDQPTGGEQLLVAVYQNPQMSSSTS